MFQKKPYCFSPCDAGFLVVPKPVNIVDDYGNILETSFNYVRDCDIVGDDPDDYRLSTCLDSGRNLKPVGTQILSSVSRETPSDVLDTIVNPIVEPIINSSENENA